MLNEIDGSNKYNLKVTNYDETTPSRMTVDFLNKKNESGVLHMGACL